MRPCVCACVPVPVPVRVHARVRACMRLQLLPQAGASVLACSAAAVSHRQQAVLQPPAAPRKLSSVYTA